MASSIGKAGYLARYLTFEQLHVLRVIADTRSFSRAAEALFLTQPAVSQRVKHLESTIGTKIFERGSGRVSQLTPAGTVLIRFADEVFRELNRVCDEIEQQCEADGWQVLSIASGPMVGRHVLPKLVATLQQRCPRVRVRLFQATPLEIRDLVRGGHVDVGVQAGACLDDGLQSIALTSDDVYLVGPADHPILDCGGDMSQIRHYGFASTPAFSNLRQIADDWARSLGIGLNVVLEASNIDALKAGVLHTGLLALLPSRSVEQERMSGEIEIIAAEGLPRKESLYLIASQKHHLTEATRTLFRIAEEGRWGADGNGARTVHEYDLGLMAR